MYSRRRYALFRLSPMLSSAIETTCFELTQLFPTPTDQLRLIYKKVCLLLRRTSIQNFVTHHVTRAVLKRNLRLNGLNNCRDTHKFRDAMLYLPV